MSTTFGDLILSNYRDPYSLLAIGLAVATVGMFSHWFKIVYKDKEPVNFVQYFFVQNRRASLIAFITMLGSLVVTFGPLDYTQLTVYQVITQAFTLGYASDSVFNNHDGQC